METLFPPAGVDVLAEGSVLAERYVIQRTIGIGGMGMVYAAKDTMLGVEQLALKILHPDFADDQRATQRFLREVQLTRKLNHKNVVRTFDVGVDGPHFYFTMEFVDGRPLDQVIDGEGVRFEDLPQLILELCDGLQAIHDAGIIHRDLKPANVLITAKGELKIADFGIARQEFSELTAHNEIIGSTMYMAPEVWLGQKQTHAVDLYSVGVLLYLITAGTFPFPRESPAEMMRYHLERIPTAPKDVNPKVPTWLNRLVMQLMAKTPQERPQSAAEIVDYVKFHTKTIDADEATVSDSGSSADASFLRSLENQERQPKAHVARAEVFPVKGATKTPPKQKPLAQSRDGLRQSFRLLAVALSLLTMYWSAATVAEQFLVEQVAFTHSELLQLLWVVLVLSAPFVIADRLARLGGTWKGAFTRGIFTAGFGVICSGVYFCGVLYGAGVQGPSALSGISSQAGTSFASVVFFQPTFYEVALRAENEELQLAALEIVPLLGSFPFNLFAALFWLFLMRRYVNALKHVHKRLPFLIVLGLVAVVGLGYSGSWPEPGRGALGMSHVMWLAPLFLWGAIFLGATFVKQERRQRNRR